MNHSHQKIQIVLITLLLALMWAAPVFAHGISIDGKFEDWEGKASLVDPHGADDAKAYTDITEFRAYADKEGLYLLKAWDDTALADASTAGITLRTAKNEYYRIYTTAMGDPGSVPPKTLLIALCSDSTCEEQKTLCEGEDCAKAGSGTSWVDPFPDRRSRDCSGEGCGKLDTAVELFIPWDNIGGAPLPDQFIFLQFGSYPQGPAPKPYDDTGKEGLACRNTKDTFQCYLSTPTAVTLSSFNARAESNNALILLGVGALVLALGMHIVLSRKNR